MVTGLKFSLLLLSSVMLALPPSACCLLGAADCGDSVSDREHASYACCRHKQQFAPGCCTLVSETAPSQTAPPEPSDHACGCLIPEAKVPPVTKAAVLPALDWNPLASPAEALPLVAFAQLRDQDLGCDLSPARHVRLCVWRL